MESSNVSLFSAEIGKNTYRISDSAHGPTSDGFSSLPGTATANSYLVVGSKKALLIDLAIDTPELLDFAKKIASVPVETVLTHGHPDHIFFLENVGAAYAHPMDFGIIRSGMGGIFPPCSTAELLPLEDGQTLDIGGRQISVHHVPGHTKGSIVLLDSDTGLLFAGDTCARRLLYGLTPTVTLDEHCRYLENVKKMDFSSIYTAHDRCPLPKKYIDTILHCIRQELPLSEETVDIPGFGKMRNLHHGTESTLDYFDMAVTEEYVK